MIENVIVKNLNKYEDMRGWLTEIYRDDETEYRPVMAYVSVTKSGTVRGPHEHAKQTDCFIFLGPGTFELHLWDRQPGSKTNGEHMKIEVGVDNPTMVIVPPGVVHAYKCISEADAYTINLPNRLYRGRDKKGEIDEIRWEEVEDSPYVIK